MFSQRTSAAARAHVISRAVQRSNHLRFSANPPRVVPSAARPRTEPKNVESPFGLRRFATASGASPDFSSYELTIHK